MSSERTDPHRVIYLPIFHNLDCTLWPYTIASANTYTTHPLTHIFKDLRTSTLQAEIVQMCSDLVGADAVPSKFLFVFAFLLVCKLVLSSPRYHTNPFHRATPHHTIPTHARFCNSYSYSCMWWFVDIVVACYVSLLGFIAH